MPSALDLALWSNGQPACPKLRQSKFESHWIYSFISLICLKREKIKQKEVVNDPFKTKL